MDLSNREWASIILIAVLLLFGIFNMKVRSSFVAVLKSAGNRHILTVVTLYVLLMMWVSDILVRLGLWSWDRWPNLVFWSLFVGCPTVFSVAEVGKQEGFFRTKAKNAIGLSAFVGLIAEVHSFPLWIEILLPLVALVFWTGGYGPQQDQRNRGCFRGALAVVSILVIANSLVWAVSNISLDWAREHGMSTLVVMGWTFSTLTFLFCFSIYDVYQIAFLKFKFADATPSLPTWKARLAVTYAIGLDVELAYRFKPYWARRVLQATSFGTALERMDEFKFDVHQALEQRRLHELRLSITPV